MQVQYVGEYCIAISFSPTFFPSCSLSTLSTVTGRPSFKPSPSQIRVILIDTEIWWWNFVWLMNNGLERKWKCLWPAVIYCPGICPERLRKNEVNPVRISGGQAESWETETYIFQGHGTNVTEWTLVLGEFAVKLSFSGLPNAGYSYRVCIFFYTHSLSTLHCFVCSAGWPRLIW